MQNRFQMLRKSTDTIEHIFDEYVFINTQKISEGNVHVWLNGAVDLKGN